MTSNRKRLIGALALAGLIGPAAADQDLLETYAQALEGDPQIAAARAQLRADQEKLAQARSLFLPQVGLEAGANRVWQDVERDAPSAFSAPDSYDTNSIGVGVTQPLFRKESFTLYEQAKTIIDQAELNYALARQQLSLRVAEAYFQVLQAQNALQSFDAELAAISQQLQRAKRAFELGTATIADVNEAQARYDLTQARRIQALNDVEVAREALRRITGQPVAELARLQSSFDPVVPEPSRSHAWAERAERENLQVRLAQAAYELAREEVERQRAQRYPKVDLVARYGRQDGVALGIEQTTTQGTVGVELTMPLYTGGAISSQIREAQANKDRALEQVRTAKRSASLSAETAYLQLTASLQQARALEQALKSIIVNEQSTQRGVELGLRTTLDLLDIQRERYAAERDLAAARYRYLLNYLQLQAAVGEAVEADAVQAVNQFLFDQ
jgi:outer membrane protein